MCIKLVKAIGDAFCPSVTRSLSMAVLSVSYARGAAVADDAIHRANGSFGNNLTEYQLRIPILTSRGPHKVAKMPTDHARVLVVLASGFSSPSRGKQHARDTHDTSAIPRFPRPAYASLTGFHMCLWSANNDM